MLDEDECSFVREQVKYWFWFWNFDFLEFRYVMFSLI
jgi:hypothetical protein